MKVEAHDFEYMTACTATPSPLERKGERERGQERVSLKGVIVTHLSKIYRVSLRIGKKTHTRTHTHTHAHTHTHTHTHKL